MTQLKRYEVPKIAFPLILSNLTVPLLGLTDSIVVGHLHSAYFLAAIGFGVTIFDFIYWCFGFLRQGTTGLLAQAFGRQDMKSCVHIFERGFVLAVGIALVLLVLQNPIAHIVQHFLYQRQTLAVYTLAYFHVRIWGALPTLVNYVFIAWFLGVKRTRYCLYQMMVVNGLAIVFDIILVFIFKMNVRGVALADVIGQWSGAVYGGYVFLSRESVRCHLSRFIFQWQPFKRLLTLNRDVFIRAFCLMLTFLFFNYRSALFGKDILAANTALINIMMLMAYAQDGFNNTAEILVGNSLGAKDISYFWQSIRATCWYSFLVGIISLFLYLCAGDYLVLMITSIPQVVTVADLYMPYVIISPMITIWCFWLDGIFMGAAWGKEMRNGMVLSLICFLVIWYLTRSYANHGLWLAFLSFFMARGIIMGAFFWIKTRPLKISAV